MLDRSLDELAAGFRARRVSPVEVVRDCLSRISQDDLGAFICVMEESALAEARAAEAEIAAGRWRGPLHGAPIAVKDLLDVAGVPTTAASALYLGRVPADDSEVVRRLRAAGAVIVGKTNLHEHAYGASGIVSHFGPTRNPRDTSHIAGGSSSGSGAAVAAGMCAAAIGSDTSGSIRIPASFCGVVGMKPTYGLVSVRGAQALASSYDTVGPMARTVRDAALVLDAIAGFDAEDPWGREGASFAIADEGPRPRVGVARAMFFENLDPEVAAAVEAAVAVAKGLAATLRDVTIPVDDDRTVFLAESYALHRVAVAETPEKFQPETLRRLGSGARVTAGEYIDQRARLLRLRRDAAAVFAEADLVITPTVAAPAPRLADLQAEPERLRARELAFMRNTRPFNILGIPTISIPCGATGAGLPIGLQISGAAGADDAVLRFGAALERALSAPPPTRIG